ncbi:Main-like [Thalictrum thalictroides]|uniref:Main-like n=1 Tax=Thalictrum thalictroides TaxID=46969 RepID=A0A7J6VEA5_THATH|nr:Main-like [Thalictrum thalictroides]
MARMKNTMFNKDTGKWVDTKKRKTQFGNASARKRKELCLLPNDPIPENSDNRKSVDGEQEYDEQDNDVMDEQVQEDEEHANNGRGARRKKGRERTRIGQLEYDREENVDADDNENGEENREEKENESGEENMEDGETFPFPGGPMVKDVLVDYKEHFAHRVWQGEERGVQRLVCHLAQLKKWPLDKEDPKFISKLEETGLHWVAAFPYKNMNPSLVFGLPIVGTPITSDQKELDSKRAVKLLNTYLGVSKEDAELELSKHNYTHVSTTWLCNNFHKKVTSRTARRSVEHAVKAYLMFLFACVLFPEKTGTDVSVSYIIPLMTFSKIKEFSWGAAVLAHIYRSLGKASRADCKQFSGFITLIEAWIYEHFPNFTVIPNLKYIHSMPRMMRWSPFSVSYTNNMQALRWFREKIDCMTAMEVHWDPYFELRASTRPLHEISFYHGVIYFFDVAEAYHANRVLRQLGHKQGIPPSTIIPIKSRRTASTIKYEVMHGRYDVYFSQWESHKLDSQARGDRATVAWQVSADFLDWYHKISHPVMIPKDNVSLLHRGPPINSIKIIDEIAHHLKNGLEFAGEQLSRDAMHHFNLAYKVATNKSILLLGEEEEDED